MTSLAGLRRVSRAAVWMAGLVMAGGCADGTLPGLPPGSPFSPLMFEQGVAAGDVSSDGAVLWTRAKSPSRVQLEWGPVRDGEPRWTGRSPLIAATAEHDLTIKYPVEGLSPNTTYAFRFRPGTVPEREDAASFAVGRFHTAPASNDAKPVRLIWSGDLGGQGNCRLEAGGYAIFDQMRKASPDMAVMLGDLIYGDEACPSPPNVPGSNFVATTLDQYRTKHRYQRDDAALRGFLAEVPVYAIWDDHEVENNFSGTVSPRMPLGRQAIMEYWPIRVSGDDPHRLYRSVRWGANVELFILDTRQYRSPNSMPDGEAKVMLGEAQRTWLIDGLRRSTAKWKLIASSVPLSIPKPGSPKMPGNDSWAHAADGTGFGAELRLILDALKAQGVRNVIWLATDVHFAQVNEYDPDSDGAVDFREFVAGPLAARAAKAVPPVATLRPRTLFSAGEFRNFGLLAIDERSLRVEILDENGTIRFGQTFAAQ